MKLKRFLLVIFCLVTTASFAQIDTAGLNRTDAQGRKQGVWKKYDKDKLVYEGQFKDNVPYGTFKYYHDDGKLKSVTDFKQGIHEVKTTIYHPNGHKASEGIFIDQQKHGVWKYYTQNDVLITVEGYDHGKKDGLWQTFAPQTGILLEECNYSDDKRNGPRTTYYMGGDKSLEENYINGKLNGRSTAYYPKEIVSTTGMYHNGFRTGMWDFCDINGKQRSTVEYKGMHVLKTYIYLYAKDHVQKINQDVVAYFLKKGDKSVAVLTNGNKIELEESLDDVSLWADFMVFTRIAPSVIASSNAIVGYKEVEGSENDAITIELRPATELEVYSEGREAKMVKALFNHEKPKE